MSPDSDDIYFQVSFGLSKKVHVQKRLVYNSFDMLGDIGGLFEMLQIVLSVLCGLFAQKLFLVSQVMTFFTVSSTSLQFQATS